MSPANQRISRFLIIDNNQEQALFFKLMLMNKQFQNVTLCHDPEDAMEQVELKRIQFLIAAWEMEPMSGTVLVQRIRSHQQFQHIPFLIYSKNMSPLELQLAHDMNIKNILTVPIEEREAFQVVEQMIQQEDALSAQELTIRSVSQLIVERQFQAALETLKPALIKGPHYGKAKSVLGELYFAENDLSKAEEAFIEALALEPDDYRSKQRLAKIYASTGRSAKAIAMLSEMSTSSPYNIETMINLTNSYVMNDQHDKARETIEKVRALDPTNPRIDDELGKLAFKEGDFGLATELLAETQNPEEVVRHFNNVAIGLVHKSNVDKGVATYQAAMKLMKDTGLYHILQYNLGIAYKKQGELRKAFKLLAECYEANPLFTKAYASFVRVVKMMEKKGLPYDRARADKLKNLHTKPEKSA